MPFRYFRVLGFDHTALNDEQRNWSEYLYPYKITEYEHVLLSSPMEIGRLDYHCECPSSTSVISKTDTCLFTCNGSCDGILIWVDYDITPDGSIKVKSYENGSFFSQAKVSVKFFETPVSINLDNKDGPRTDRNRDCCDNSIYSKLCVRTSFEYGASDFSYTFWVE